MPAWLQLEVDARPLALEVARAARLAGVGGRGSKKEPALNRARTDDLRLIRATRYQLRYESGWAHSV